MYSRRPDDKETGVTVVRLWIRLPYRESEYHFPFLVLSTNPIPYRELYKKTLIVSSVDKCKLTGFTQYTGSYCNHSTLPIRRINVLLTCTVDLSRPAVTPVCFFFFTYSHTLIYHIYIQLIYKFRLIFNCHLYTLHKQMHIQYTAL